MKKILVFSPHPDDEVLGCGGTLIRYSKKNYQLHWIILTEANKSNGWNKKNILNRDKEIEKISNYLKIKKTFKLNFPTTKISSISETEIISKLEKIIKEISPSEILIPFIEDAHSDHRISTQIFNTLIKPFRYPFIEKVLMYETISETNLNFLFNRKFNPNYFVNISKYLDQKIKAMQIYKSELGKHPFPRSKESIKSLAILRGSQVNLKYAEAFEIVYQINK